MIEYNVWLNVWIWLNYYLFYFKVFNLVLMFCSIEMLLVFDSVYCWFLVEFGVVSMYEFRYGVYYGEEDV